MKQQYTHLLLTPILMFLLSTASGASEVASEGLVFLKEDGRSYLLQRSMRSTRDRHDFHVDKDIGLKDFLYIEPNEYTWDDATDPDVNTLRFSGGSFTVMYPGTYAEELTVDEAGIHTLTSWDGTTREDDHFGMWHEPGNFTRFVYAWVFPDNLKILDYESNREGEWVERNNTVAFFATDVNDLTFTLKFEQVDAEGDDAFNLDLSQRRAESVRAYLISKGISPGNLSARGYGEQQPVKSNETPQGRAENRRVELLRTDASR